MSIYSDSSTSKLISKSEFLSSLPPWRRWLARLNWHPTIDAQIRAQESERRTRLIESDIERLQTENKRLAALEFKLDSLLLSADSSSQTPPETDCN
jgi:hypothetical protein